jgi:hypothetical protein
MNRDLRDDYALAGAVRKAAERIANDIAGALDVSASPTILLVPLMWCSTKWNWEINSSQCAILPDTFGCDMNHLEAELPLKTSKA